MRPVSPDGPIRGPGNGSEALTAPLPLTIEPASPSHPDAQQLLWIYFDELVTRYQRRPATEAEIRDSLVEGPKR